MDLSIGKVTEGNVFGAMPACDLEAQTERFEGGHSESSLMSMCEVNCRPVSIVPVFKRCIFIMRRHDCEFMRVGQEVSVEAKANGTD